MRPGPNLLWPTIRGEDRRPLFFLQVPICHGLAAFCRAAAVGPWCHLQRRRIIDPRCRKTTNRTS